MLSIIIPTYQRVDLLRRCLASLDHHAPAGTEIVVVDDASPGTQVRDLIATQPRIASSPIVYLRQQRRSGFAAAANAGIRASRGDIIELLNDDTEVQPGWAEQALQHFRDESVGAVAPLVLKLKPDNSADTIDSAGDRYFVGGIAGKRGHGNAIEASPLRTGWVFGASASSAFYRRAALDRVGLFPESFHSYFEDVDLAFRLQRAGYRACFEPGARVLHHVSASFGRTSRWLLQQQSTNEERVFWRNLPARWMWRALPLHLAVLMAKAARRWREGTLAPFVCGRLRLLLEIPDLWRHRRELARLGPDAAADVWCVDTGFWKEPG